MPKKITANTKRPDIEKCCRALADARAGIVYEDDAQVDQLVARELYGLPEGTKVQVFADAWLSVDVERNLALAL